MAYVAEPHGVGIVQFAPPSVLSENRYLYAEAGRTTDDDPAAVKVTEVLMGCGLVGTIG